MAAIKMEDELFNAMPYDGMLGLSMAGLSSGTGCVFFKRLMDSTWDGNSIECLLYLWA